VKCTLESEVLRKLGYLLLAAHCTSTHWCRSVHLELVQVPPFVTGPVSVLTHVVRVQCAINAAHEMPATTSCYVSYCASAPYVYCVSMRVHATSTRMDSTTHTVIMQLTCATILVHALLLLVVLITTGVYWRQYTTGYVQ
jgi:hypothetical protein